MEKPLHITHYVPEIRLAQGGIVRTVLDWCAVFARRGHRVRLFCNQGDDLPADWLNDQPGCPSARVLPTSKSPLKLLNRAALDAIKQALLDTDVLHLHAPWFAGNRQIANLARHAGLPYILTIHGMLDDWSMSQRGPKKRLYLALFGRRFLNGAAMIHSTAEGELRQATRWFSNPNVTVLPYLTDLSPFEQLHGPDMARAAFPFLRGDDPVILFLSRLHEKKGVDLLIHAVALLRERGQRPKLVLAGPGDPAYITSLQDLVNELKLRNVVHFAGLVTGDTKLSLYEAADVFVLPTLQENYGVVLIESLACGTPVITTRGTDIWPEMRAAGGIITDWQPSSIADALTTVLGERSPDRADQGRRWVFDNLATDVLAAKYESLYGELAKARGDVR